MCDTVMASQAIVATTRLILNCIQLITVKRRATTETEEERRGRKKKKREEKLKHCK